jgi:ribose/xylose/arabinose/galactoside ABC-type transport system permease subunit
MNPRRYIQGLLNNLIWILLLGMVILFSALTPRFLTVRNITDIFVHGAVLGILVIGQTFTLITGNFDLSMESTLAICALAGAWLILPAGAPTFGGNVMLNPLLAPIVVLVLGLAIGWFNGTLITRLKMNNFIVTLAMLIVLRGLVLGISEGRTMVRLPPQFTALGGASIGPVPVCVIVMVLAFIIAYVVLMHLPFGRKLFAVGGNKDAALAAGLNPDQRIRDVYMISGVLAALAGWMFAGRQGVITEGMGQNMILEVFAAAIIGGVSIFGGRGSVIGAFGGVLLLSALDSGLSLTRVNTFWIDAARGMVILLAMLIDAQKVRYAAVSPVRKPAPTGSAAASTGD